MAISVFAPLTRESYADFSSIHEKRPKVSVAADGNFVKFVGFWAPNEARPKFRALGVLAGLALRCGGG